MSTASERTIHMLEYVVKKAPVGTNLALLHLLWAMLCGAFLESRGAVFPALQRVGFAIGQIRRCGQALRTGSWDIADLIVRWHEYVLNQGEWQPNSYAGYCPVAADLTTFWRPRLQGWLAKFFHHIANRAIKGIGVGLVVQVGRIGERRIPVLKRIICARQDDVSESQLKRRTLQAAARILADQEVLIHDGGASIADVQKAGVTRYVVRMPLNCTGRRNQLPPYKGIGRHPEYGKKVRPLARTRKARTIPATPPDVKEQFQFQGRTIHVHGWHGLVRPDQKVDTKHETFRIWVYFDPLYSDPLVLGTNLTATPKAIFQLYLDRWPVEQVPLVAKQLLGLQRQFVFAHASRHRLPELALLAANMLTYLAAVLPPLSTGFWDRCPKRTPGRLRRVLARLGFPKKHPLDRRLRKKRSVTSHLPKGIEAHRRQKVA